MRFCANKLSGLSLTRQGRIAHAFDQAEMCGLPSPDPWPQRRWTKSVIPWEELGLSKPPDAKNPVCIAVPDGSKRPQSSLLASTVYSTGLPPGSFLRVSDCLFVPCPELLFLELARIMHPAALALVGYELCGTYARDPANPRSGDVTHDLEPVTSVDKIANYIDRCQSLAGATPALAALEHVRDGARSAPEALVALLLVRPVSELGYGLGPITLNERMRMPLELAGRTEKDSRVPDIMLDDLGVGFNYDGRDHLDLALVRDAAGDPFELKRALYSVRAKYVDDIRRNRELAAQGSLVFPVVSEDLYADGGLDTVVLEAVMAAERLHAGEMGRLPRGAWEPDIAHKRQRLIWSLLPGFYGDDLGAY